MGAHVPGQIRLMHPGTTIEEWLAEGERRGLRKQGDQLRPPRDATTVRVRNGELLITDGPFTESQEWIAGYDIIDCADLDEAVVDVSRHPMARFGRIEIRPVLRMDD